MACKRFLKLKAKSAFFFRGHLCNPLCLTRGERRLRREQAQARMVCAYLKDCGYVKEEKPCPQERPEAAAETEKVYSLWIDGEENAPALVRSCLDSVRRNFGRELVVMNLENVVETAGVPEKIIEKFRAGKIRPAAFSDICRASVLALRGGYWIDATCLVSAPVPDWIDRLDFFVYSAAGLERYGYSFVQSCFIRARKGSLIMKRWAGAFLDYWMNEDSDLDYFHFHLTLKALLEADRTLAEKFAAMPEVSQRPTHELQILGLEKPFDEGDFKRITSGAFFQKLTYKGMEGAPKGSYYDRISKLWTTE